MTSKKEGTIYKGDDTDRVRAEYTNNQTGEHHCMPFASEEGAVAWLTSKGIEFKSIQHVSEMDQPDMPKELEGVLKQAFSGLDHRLNALAKIKAMDPKSVYHQEDLMTFENDAITNMVILAKLGVPSTPEGLEDWLQSRLAGTKS